MKKIFTNGCFDILHRGHISLLSYCRDLGGEVIVGLNSDKSVKLLKGENRPIVSENDRKYILESIKYVDKVIIFDEETPYNLIRLLKPDIIVKGGDYSKEEVVGSDLCEVELFDYNEEYSTTKIIQDITDR
jgi:D-beta-D-heptose 7-phosphate kinase/D-beta-D-heptose 1-phosphate adenosyltransferase